jgi:hypothetical protein
MYHSPAIHSEEAFLRSTPQRENVDSPLPADSFRKGTPCLVEIPPSPLTGLLEFTLPEKDLSLITNSTLGAQSNQHAQIFWSKPEVEICT